ncbi:hypothetical protein NCC49_002563 [Naganishia albida]|nr:hypothetical protein NCC49_002563 [Naganishia albida]
MTDGQTSQSDESSLVLTSISDVNSTLKVYRAFSMEEKERWEWIVTFEPIQEEINNAGGWVKEGDSWVVTITHEGKQIKLGKNYEESDGGWAIVPL